MKNYLLLCALPIIALCGGLWACSYEDEPDMNHPGKIQVTLTVSSGAMTGITRSTDENTIRDLNFHLCDKAGSVVLHRYQTAATLHFECLPGDYTLYVVANMHEDMGDLSQAQLMAYAVPHKTDYEDLPMTGLLEISILASQGATVQLPTLEVRRQVAKVAYNIAVIPADIELHSMRICSVPKSAGLFAGEDAPSRQDANYTNTSEVAVSGREASGVCYLLPNPQGTVGTITDQRQKNADNAPVHASYLLIQATRGKRVLTYRVYLGENNTDNFDVRRNTFHTLNITIRGDDEIDTRMSGYTVSVWDDLEDGGGNGYCIADSPKHLYVRVESSGDAPALSYTVDVATGDGNALSIGGKNYKDAVYAVSSCNGTNSYSLDYAPTVFSSLNDKLRYAVTVRDEYGFGQEFEFTRTFTNLLRVKVLGGGSVTVSSALHTTDTADSKIILGNSCSLRTTASVGCVFEGWYSDEACTTQVSSSTVYSYTAKSRSQTLYAKFVMAEHTPLDTNGTANCYIAPKKLTRYSFDATVMGKGDWSTNIQPKKLSGTTAKVIWETEAHNEYESVVRYALYEKGRIYFATGSKYGNAVIGLFDASGKCIWLWHIWAVDYDPEASVETYGSDIKFMNRNLGVLSKSMTERGLYYRWGRKAPFIYPENATSATARAERRQQPEHRPQVVKLQRNGNTFYLAPVDTLADGERVMSLQIEQVTVVSKMRSVPERNGRVVLDFIVTLPKALLGGSRSVVITPVLHKPDGRMELEDLVIRGGRFSLLQQRDYWQYETYIERFRPDTLGREAAFNRFVKFPYTEDARLDSVVERHGMMTYYYSQEVPTDETSKRMTVTLEGKVVGIDDSAYRLPPSDTLSYVVSSMLSFVDTLPRYRIKIIEKYVTVTDRSYIRFHIGRTEVVDTLGDNRRQLDKITDLMRQIVEQEEFYVDTIMLTATASPEGSHAANEWLARGRAEALKRYLVKRYGRQIDTMLTVRWVAEDWDELTRLINGSRELPYGDEILELIASEKNPDRREQLIRHRYPAAYARIRSELYPHLRAVNFRYDLRRKGMVKDTIHTTDLDTAYARGVELLQKRKYARALYILNDYNDRNTVVAHLSLGHDERALELLAALPKDAVTEYLQAIACSRLGRKEEGRRYFLEACRLDQRMEYRGNLDPEITELLKD